MAEIISFTDKKNCNIDPKKVISDALEESFESVVIMGVTKDGEHYFASSSGDFGHINLMLDRMKAGLLDMENI